ncbi:hypothetical protein Tco_1557626 [Tanacetum coccineum]
MSGEHIRNEYGSSRCTRKEARFLVTRPGDIRSENADMSNDKSCEKHNRLPVEGLSINPSYKGLTPALSTGGRRGNNLVKARAKPTQSEAIYTEQEPALE